MPGQLSAAEDDLEGAGVRCMGENVVRLGEFVQAEAMGDELPGADLVTREQSQQRRRGIRVDQAGRDSDVPDPLLFQMQRGRPTVHADIGDPPSGTRERDGQLPTAS